MSAAAAHAGARAGHAEHLRQLSAQLSAAQEQARRAELARAAAIAAAYSAGLTQAEIAAETGLTEGRISQIRRGGR